MLLLDRFLPYRLSVLSNTISRQIADAYQARFSLSIPEWRVMAILAHHPGLGVNGLAERSAIDKVAVSRAVKRLMERRLVAASAEKSSDGRRQPLALTGSGRSIYEEIVPLATGYEDALVAVLSGEEREALDRIISKLQAHAEEMGR